MTAPLLRSVMVVFTSAHLAAACWAADAASVPELAARLSGTEAAQRLAAADALADLGPRAAEAVPNLIESLKSSDADLRWRAVRALGAIGDKRAAPALYSAAADQEPAVRAQTIFAIGRLGVGDEQAIQAITAGLKDKDVHVRRASVRALRSVQADRKLAVPLVLRLLEDDEPSVVMPALYTIAEAGAEVTPALSEALRHPEARYWACLVLAEIGPEAKTAVPALVEVLSDERPEVRLQAVVALGEIGPAAKPAAAALEKLLQDEFTALRAAAMYALGQIGDRQAVQAVAAADQASDPFLHTLNVWAQSKLDPDNAKLRDQAVALLVEKLGAEDRQIAQVAARALADLDATNKLVETRLDQALAAADDATADRIVRSLSSLGPRIVPYTVRSLQHPDRRATAMRILDYVGPEAAPAVPNLVELLDSADTATRVHILQILGGVGPQAEPATIAVAEMLDDADRTVALTAAYCLGKIGPPAKAAIPALRAQLKSDDKVVRMTAVWALLQIGPKTEPLVEMALPVLTETLKHEQEFMRLEAALALGEIGPSARPALAALETITSDRSPLVRRAAAEAIRRIGPAEEVPVEPSAPLIR